MKQKYERTWCDYLTPCKIKPHVMVGEYECCEKCPYFKSIKENPSKKFDPCDYARYSYVHTGEVECTCDESELMELIKKRMEQSKSLDPEFSKVIDEEFDNLLC